MGNKRTHAESMKFILLLLSIRIGCLVFDPIDWSFSMFVLVVESKFDFGSTIFAFPSVSVFFVFISAWLLTSMILLLFVAISLDSNNTQKK